MTQATNSHENTTPNELTIAAYDRNVQSYLDHTSQAYKPHSHLQAWIDAALSRLAPQSSVLEVGSATPRDARYIRSHGFTVQCSDATPHFVEYLKAQGEPAFILNLLTDPLPPGYDMIFANAVIQHFTREDLPAIFQKIHTALGDRALFAFSTKTGSGETWVTEKFEDERYICFWQPDELEALTRQTGFEIVYAETALGDCSDYDWRMIVAQKVKEPHAVNRAF